MASKAILEQKSLIVAEIKEKIQNAKCIVMIDYKGISVKNDTELRNTFRKAGVEYKVLRNTMVRKAFNELGITDFDKDLNGTTAVAFSNSDIVAPAKIVIDMAKKIPQVVAKCGFVENKRIDANGVKALASIPSKEVLLAQLLGLLTSPMRSLAIAINEIAKKNS